MRKLLIVGNWKMNGSKTQTAELLNALLQKTNSLGKQIECVVCPASPYLSIAHDIIKSSNTEIQLGAQNIAPQNISAFTGEISPLMLHEFLCNYVIIGHSERRKLLQESDMLIAQKLAVALDAKIRPILCVGETQVEQAEGIGPDVVAAQLRAGLDDICVSELKGAAIAYEPVWAIGTGLSATPEQAQSMHAHIRNILSEYDANIAADMRIIYGGSVNGANASQLLLQPDIDGCLVGGASLKAQDFSDICHIAMGISK